MPIISYIIIYELSIIQQEFFNYTQMIPHLSFFSLFLFFLSHVNPQPAAAAAQSPNTTGYVCTTNHTTYPCQTYAFYRATPPNFLDLVSIANLFSVSPLMISKPSNLSSPTSPLFPHQSLFVPLTCSCNTLNSTAALSFANLTYAILKGDTFYILSSSQFQNLTTFQSVQLVNPTLVPTNLDIGQNVFFPIFCKCPNRTQLQNQVNYLLSYVFQPSDSLSSVASMFGVQTQAITGVNGHNVHPFDTIFIPVNRLPQLLQPAVAPSASDGKDERKGLVTWLAIGLGISGGLLILMGMIWIYRENSWKQRRKRETYEENRRAVFGGERRGLKEIEKTNLIADVSDCLDRYRVFKIEDLREATDDFSEKFVIQGSVYKGWIDGEVYAIKKMNWNAYEELKILQKVNHGNLVKLEGFCIDAEDATCYLVYEYIENGSLHLWLHSYDDNGRRLNWKTRLRIAVDVANALEYIHEHTRPRVVHKDIKTTNILLDSTMRAKIANFGLAKSGCNAITMHIVGTQGYIAPEYLAEGVVSTKMDVFSFGVVLLELISGKDIIDEEGKLLWINVIAIWEGNDKTKMTRLRGLMDKVLLEETCSMESVMSVMSVAIACLQKDPSRRPSMVDIVYALSKSDDLFFDISDDGLSVPPITAR